MAVMEPSDWDKAAHQLSNQIDSKILLKQAEMLAEMEAELGPLPTPKTKSTVLKDNEPRIKDAIANKLVKLGIEDSPSSYEYRGPNLTVGNTYHKTCSYSASYYPHIEEKRGQIWITINDMTTTCHTLCSFVLEVTPSE